MGLACAVCSSPDHHRGNSEIMRVINDHDDHYDHNDDDEDDNDEPLKIPGDR